MTEDYTIILFYKYVPIEDPKTEMIRQKGVCDVLGLKGRMIVAEEGINATLEGTTANVEKYMEWMKTDKRFRKIHWKKSHGQGDAFPRLSVKVRSEIVSLNLHEQDINPNAITGIHLPPAELAKWYAEGKEFYIVDMRNDYELKVGKFEGTVFPGLENFRDLKSKLPAIEHLKDKTVLTVCTGGVRCEKASGLLKREGFENVYQLDGGIVSYMEKFPGQHFRGSLYVFDNRLTMHFNDPAKHEIIGVCERCGDKSERYVNCANLACHRHFIVCDACLLATGDAYCTTDCENTGVKKSALVQ